MQLRAIDGFDAHKSHDLSALTISSASENVFQAVLALSIVSHRRNGRHRGLLFHVSEELRVVLVCLLARQALAVHLLLLLPAFYLSDRLLQGQGLRLISSHDIVNSRAFCADEDVLRHVDLEVLSQGLVRFKSELAPGLSIVHLAVIKLAGHRLCHRGHLFEKFFFK